MLLLDSFSGLITLSAMVFLLASLPVIIWKYRKMRREFNTLLKDPFRINSSSDD